ncbi:hypothetical protein BOS5A_10478 [Bosea sp. EC-HK365B]|nr:hypothetical protein BOS5A_10478 [Bosea sp. EC-HK365B]
MIVVRADLQDREIACGHRRRCGEDVVAGEGDVLDGGAEAVLDEAPGQGPARAGPVQGDAQAAGLHRLRADQPVGIDDVDDRRLMGVEDAGVEQRPAQHLVIGHGLADMVDPRQAGTRGCRARSEVDVPDAAEIGRRIQEAQDAAADAANGGDAELALAGGLRMRLGEQGAGAFEGGARIGQHQCDLRHRRAVDEIGAVGETAGVGVDQHVDAALPPQAHRLRDVVAGLFETAGAQQRLDARRFRRTGGEFEELDPRNRGRRGKGGQVRGQRRLDAAHPVHHGDQAAMAVLRHQARQARAELVVEDLQAQRPGIACRGHGAHEAGDVEIAFARHVAEVARPVEQVHVDRGRVGELHEEDPVAGDGADRIRIDAPAERMEAVEDQADIRMVGAPHHLPGVAMVVDEAAPAQRLEADTHAMPFRQIAEIVKILGHAVDAAEGGRMRARADQHEIGAELVHQLEFAGGAGEGPAAIGLGQALEIAEGLEQGDLKSGVAHHLADLAGREIRGEKVLLEDLDAVEAGARDGFELLRKIAGQRDRCDRRLHSLPFRDGARLHAPKLAWPEAGEDSPDNDTRLAAEV